MFYSRSRELEDVDALLDRLTNCKVTIEMDTPSKSHSFSPPLTQSHSDHGIVYQSYTQNLLKRRRPDLQTFSSSVGRGKPIPWSNKQACSTGR